jgi:D-3-phosphoglycerate dehydrogenase
MRAEPDLPNVLLAGHYLDLEIAGLAEDYTLHRLADAMEPDTFLANVGPTIRAMVTRGDVGADSTLMAALPNLEIVASFGVGFDAIDLDYARKRAIRVTNTPDVLTDDVADMGIALLLAVARRIPTGDHHVRSGAWAKGTVPLTTRVSGKRLGLIGFGRVGRAIAARAAGFGLSVAYCGPRRKDVSLPWYIDPVALAANVDFLVICAVSETATRGLIGESVLKALGPNGILVNIARGSIVDEPALIAALQGRHIAGAGLDVFDREPTIDPTFATLDNVVLQPHMGSGTVETRKAIGRLVHDNLIAHFAGQPLPTPVL